MARKGHRVPVGIEKSVPAVGDQERNTAHRGGDDGAGLRPRLQQDDPLGLVEAREDEGLTAREQVPLCDRVHLTDRLDPVCHPKAHRKVEDAAFRPGIGTDKDDGYIGGSEARERPDEVVNGSPGP